jgi:Na+/proline symporter
MLHLDLSTFDWVVLWAYIVIICITGLLAGRGVKDTDTYFLGGRKFGKFVMMGQSFGVGTHAEQPVSLAGAVYSHGLSGIWFQWKNLFATPFYWLMAPLFRRIRRASTAELVEDRYGGWMCNLYAVFALGFFTISMASMVKGAAKVISQAVGGGVSVNGMIAAMTVIFVFYSFIGGLVASAWTNFLQGFLTIVLSFIVVPVGLVKIGGLAGIQATLSGAKLSLATPQGIGFWFIFVLTLNGLVGIAAQPHIMATVGTGRDELACRAGFFYGNFIKRICTIGWALVGLIVAVIIARGVFGDHALTDNEDAFGYACRHLLFPGGVGLLIACVLADNMSTCTTLMVAGGTMITRSFYQRYLAKGRPDSHYLLVGRLSGLLLTAMGIVYSAFLIDKVLYAFLLSETLAAYMGVSVLGGIVWPRANRWGAFASLVVAMSTNFALYTWRGERLDHWNPNVFFTSLCVGIITLVVVSLLTPPEPADKQRSFFDRLQISSDGAGKDMLSVTALDAATKEVRSRESAQLGKQLFLVNLLNLRAGARGFGILHAYRDDLNGFAIGWMITLGLILTVWLMFNV